MIAPNRNQAKRIKKNQAIHGKQNAQHVLNTLLWQIVMQNGGKLIVPCSELKGLPENIALEIKHDPKTDTLIIIAGTQEPVEKTNLILPNNGIIETEGIHLS